MSNSHVVTVEELVWARETLSLFFRMEKALKKKLGSFGKERILFKNPTYISILGLSLVISLFGIYFFFTHQNIYFLAMIGIPAGAFLIIFDIIKKESKKNIFKFLKNHNCINEDTCFIVQKHIFDNKEHFEDLLAWIAVRNGTKKSEKYTLIFDQSSWDHIDRATQQFVWLASLMIELQKFLSQNRELYDKEVRKIPLNKPNKYSPSQIKAAATTNPDKSTFQSGFTMDQTEPGN